MHVLTFVLKQAGVPGEKVDEETILNELRLADYVTEVPLQEIHFTRLAGQLEAKFGKENLAADRRTMTITVTKAGVIRYFNNLRVRIKRAVDFAMNRPIADFIHMRGESDWYAIQTMLSDPFDTQFYIDGCGSLTVFAHNLYVCMGYENIDVLTLELSQVFDVHY